MPKMCIICGGRAGSGEHIFPAALGGRRINNGIYCKKHNESLSPLVAILSGQLNSINAMLGVRPDRSDQPRQLTATNQSDGQAYLVSATNVELASPRVVTDTTVEGARHVAVQFANEHQIQEWLSEQRAAGFNVEIQKREEGKGYFARLFEDDVDGLAVDYSHLGKFSRAAHEFAAYIGDNTGSLINYGERARAGERISSCLAEPTVNAVISKRFAKGQQMQWTPRGAHLLLQTRVRALGGTLRSLFERWYAGLVNGNATQTERAAA